jgi:hypothetical protein
VRLVRTVSGPEQRAHDTPGKPTQTPSPERRRRPPVTTTGGYAPSVTRAGGISLVTPLESALADGRPIWVGDFDATGRSKTTFYYPADGNWWFGAVADHQLTWSMIDKTPGFGTADQRRTWLADFTGAQRKELITHTPSNGQWWLRTVNGGLRWVKIATGPASSISPEIFQSAWR